ncbi:reverse transcriptase domain-containing protein [Tanacetum coccineum]
MNFPSKIDHDVKQGSRCPVQDRNPQASRILTIQVPCRWEDLKTKGYPSGALLHTKMYNGWPERYAGKACQGYALINGTLYQNSFLGPMARGEAVLLRQCFASVKHAATPNGLVERANRSLGEGIKARLEEKSKDWIEELPHVLWAYRIMIKSSNGETPFSLTYGMEAVISAEIGMPTLRTAEVDQASNNEALGINLDLIEERREQAAIQEAK